MTTLNTLLNISNDLVPLVAIVFTFMVPILAIYFYYQNKNKILDERRLMIEKGITPPPLGDEKYNYQSKNPLIKGINLVAIALGLLVGYFISESTQIEMPFAIIGAIVFFLGIANILTAIINSKNNSQTSINNFDNEK